MIGHTQLRDFYVCFLCIHDISGSNTTIQKRINLDKKIISPVDKNYNPDMSL